MMGICVERLFIFEEENYGKRRKWVISSKNG